MINTDFYLVRSPDAKRPLEIAMLTHCQLWLQELAKAAAVAYQPDALWPSLGKPSTQSTVAGGHVCRILNNTDRMKPQSLCWTMVAT